jgi:hypothetical protein
LTGSRNVGRKRAKRPTSLSGGARKKKGAAVYSVIKKERSDDRGEERTRPSQDKVAIVLF